jgi:hypothetical protein
MVPHEADEKNWCSSSIYRNNEVCLYQDLFVTLDNLTLKLRMNYGEPNEEDYKVAERALDILEYLWRWQISAILHIYINVQFVTSYSMYQKSYT